MYVCVCVYASVNTDSVCSIIIDDQREKVKTFLQYYGYHQTSSIGLELFLTLYSFLLNVSCL